jgi:hypothetical protein
MSKLLTCLFCFLTYCSLSFSQNLYSVSPPATNGQSKDFIPASPSAAGLGSFGQVPVGNYTGTAEIGVPFYTVSYRDLKVPVGINYHADGNKPDAYPGITGQGWALSAGGSITRVVKGLPDMQVYPGGGNGGLTLVVEEPTSPSDWSSTTSMNTKLSQGGTFSSKDRGNPDEFYFNFNGVSGKFYCDYGGVFKVKTSDNTFYSVSVQTLNNKCFTMPTLAQDPGLPGGVTYTPRICMSKLIYKITLTDDQGVSYIFGGTDNSIEFSRPGHDYTFDQTTMSLLIVPMTWQLTSIVSPNGYSITFDYERSPMVTKVGYSDVTRISWTADPGAQVKPTPVAMAEKSTLVDACYLSTITTPKETLHFTTAPATYQLQYPHDPNIYVGGAVNQNMFSWYPDIAQAVTENLIGRELDAITVNDVNGNLSKTIRFMYSSSTDTRLKLLSAYISGNDNQISSQYSFDYNPQPLPVYNSYQTDYYGYYNGRNPYITSTTASDYFNLDQTGFIQSKAPDPNYVQAEMLTKITYPTGGYTQFIYEPNEYGATVQTWPFGTTTTANTITGGVRIKQVISCSGPGQKAFQKTYFYKTNFLTGGTASSGVLAYTPTYFDSYSGAVRPPAHFPSSPSYTGNINYWQWSSNPIFPMGETNGHHITYDEVTVANEEGFVVYKYKNYDNGYNDVQPVNQVSDNTGLKAFWQEEPGISMDLERGQVLSEEFYDAAAKIKRKNEYEYNNDPARFNSNVRVLSQVFNSPAKVGIPSLRIVASYLYTYFPYMSKQTTTEYEDGGQTLQIVTAYAYDNTYRGIKQQQTTTSDNRTLAVLNTYPQDMVAAGITDPYQDMVTAGMVNVQITSERQSDGVTLNKNITPYSKNLSTNAALILPAQLKTQFGTQPEEVRTNYTQYDAKGNMVCLAPPGGAKTCYVYTYNYAYPVAKIVNADYATVLAVLGGQAAVDNFSASTPDDNTVNTFLQSLRTDPQLSGAMVSTYIYNPMYGMTSETGVNSQRTYYEYDFMGRLSIVRDNDHNILKKICYNYAGLAEDCGVPINYDVSVLNYSTSSTAICGNGLLLVVTGYSKKPDPESIAPGQSYQASEFFSDRNLTSHLDDGYYKVISSNVLGGFNGLYYHIVNGVIVSTNLCFIHIP